MVLAMKIEDEWKIYTFSKVREQKNLLRNFPIKVGDCGEWKNFRKSCEKLARRQD